MDDDAVSGMVRVLALCLSTMSSTQVAPSAGLSLSLHVPNCSRPLVRVVPVVDVTQDVPGVDEPLAALAGPAVPYVVPSGCNGLNVSHEEGRVVVLADGSRIDVSTMGARYYMGMFGIPTLQSSVRGLMFTPLVATTSRRYFEFSVVRMMAGERLELTVVGSDVPWVITAKVGAVPFTFHHSNIAQNSGLDTADILAARRYFGKRWTSPTIIVQAFDPDGNGWRTLNPAKTPRKRNLARYCTWVVCRAGTPSALRDLSSNVVVYFAETP